MSDWKDLVNYIDRQNKILGEQGEKEDSKYLLSLWKEKTKFIRNVLIRYSKTLAAIKQRNIGEDYKRKFQEVVSELEKYEEELDVEIKQHTEFFIKKAKCKIINEPGGANKSSYSKPSVSDPVSECILPTLKLILSENYRWPKDPDDLYDHLFSLFYFTSMMLLFREINILILLKIDYVMMRLSYAAMAYILFFDTIGKRQYRVEKGKAEKQKVKAERMQPVIEAYYRIDKDGLTNHKIASTIREFLGKNRTSPPSVDTIKRYLKEEGLF